MASKQAKRLVPTKATPTQTRAVAAARKAVQKPAEVSAPLMSALATLETLPPAIGTVAGFMARLKVRPKPAPAKAGVRAAIDWTVRPTVLSATNQSAARLIAKIEAARGDAAALRALAGFKRSSTYYKTAGRFLDALLAKAEG